jgi:hypothetical protein
MMKRLRLYKPLALLLALCLLCGCQSAANSSTYNYGGAYAWLGNLIDGTYYYFVSEKGIYAYRPGETPVLRLASNRFDNYWVTDYAIYYTITYSTKYNNKIYIQPHSTQQSDLLYAIQDEDCDGYYETITEDGNLLLTITTCKNTKDPEPEDYMVYQVLVDSVTGEELGTVTEPMTSAEFSAQSGSSTTTSTSRDLPIRNWIGATGDLLLFLDRGVYSDNDVFCYDPDTKEQWALTRDADLEMASAVTDGTYLYSVHGDEPGNYDISTYPDLSKQTLWKVVYDEDGLPTALTLVEEDITALS